MNNIGWCDCTINPIVGCSKCSPGCDNCYAERFAARLARNPQTAAKYRGVVDERGKWTGKINTSDWSCFEKLPKAPRRVFVGSMTDLFHPQIPFHWLDQIFLTFLRYPQHTFLVLTKRPERAAEYSPRGGGWITDTSLITGEVTRYLFPIPNLWLGVTVCNQEEADAKIPVLLQIPAAKRFVSVEPMLSPMNIEKFLRGSYECGLSCGKRMSFRESPEMRCTKCGFVGPDDETWGNGDCAVCPECGQDGCCGAIEPICPDCGHYMVREHPDTPYIDWVICGGETGPGARSMHPEWARSLRDQCQSAGVPFYFKGWGGKGKKHPALLDGQEWHQFPK